MRTAFLFVTDQRNLFLTQHAAAIAVVTQKITKNIIIFCSGFKPEADSRLAKEAQRRGFNVEFRELVSEAFTDAEKLIRRQTHVTTTSLLKMDAINAVASEVDRALYLDGDIILTSDVNLERFDFGASPIAAVYDIAEMGGLTDQTFHERAAAHGRSPH